MVGEFAVKGSGRSLLKWVLARGGRIVVDGETAAELQAQATAAERTLKLNDARIASTAAREGIPLMTTDGRFRAICEVLGLKTRPTTRAAGRNLRVRRSAVVKGAPNRV